jgi:hypothetical protein
MMSMMAAYLPLTVLSLFLPVLAYLVARWRIYRESESPDPQLGLKAVLSFFQVMAYQAMLVGGVIVVSGLLGTSFTREAAVRSGVGVVLPAALVYAAHRLALGRTNAGERPTLPRMFDGISLGLTGIVGFTALLMAGVALFQRGSSPDRTIWALVLVYGTAWVVQALSFVNRVTAPPVAPATRVES